MLKGLKEKRNQLVGELEVMITAVGTETRSLTEEEVVAFDAKKAEIEKIDAKIGYSYQGEKIFEGLLLTLKTK